MRKGRFYVDKRPQKSLVDGAIKRLYQKENPCTQDCPDRCVGCKINCDKLKAFQERVKTVRADVEKKYKADADVAEFQISSAEKNKRRSK